MRMDLETKEYLERLLLGLTTKEDLEKLRQETKSNFRQLKEENKNQVLEWRQEVKADFEQLKKGGKPIRSGKNSEMEFRSSRSRLSLPLINPSRN
jgi:hypothetical protein